MVSTSGDAHQTMQVDIIKINYENKNSLVKHSFFFFYIRAGLASVCGRIYAIGGFNGSLRVRTVDLYEPNLDQWFPAPDMETRRSTLGVAVLNNLIYAVS